MRYRGFVLKTERVLPGAVSWRTVRFWGYGVYIFTEAGAKVYSTPHYETLREARKDARNIIDLTKQRYLLAAASYTTQTTIECDKCGAVQSEPTELSNSRFFATGWLLIFVGQKYTARCSQCQTRQERAGMEAAQKVVGAGEQVQT
jgi:DICT domain-containing protein